MDSEMTKAATAVEEEVTLFDKIVKGDIPCDKIYEDDLVLAFRDIAPTCKTHFLVIPKDREGLTGIDKAEERHKSLLGHLMITCAKVAEQENL